MKDENKYTKQKVERLDIPISQIDILKQNKIQTLGELCKYSKTDLKEMNIDVKYINKIQIELQLLGLDLKGVL